MHQVITAEQAKQITGGGGNGGSGKGSGPFTIVEYEQAVALLRECLTIEDAKRFADFAEAKAAWAKYMHDERALRLCKAFKLEAARHMAYLAERTRPTVVGTPKSARKNGEVTGGRPGAKSLLIESGLSSTDARGAIKASKLSEAQFGKLVNSKLPPSLGTLANQSVPGTFSEIRARAASFRSTCRLISPRDAFARLKNSPGTDWAGTRKLFIEISEWCDAFLAHLPPTK